MATTTLRLPPLRRPRQNWDQRLGKAFVYLTLTALGFLFAAPLVWALANSFMPIEQVGVLPPQWIPNPLQPENYGRALQFWNFGVTLRNTVVITGLTIIGDLISCSLVAYGFARYRFPGRDLLFMLLLGTLMLPFAVTMIPLYVGFSKLGWLNTFLPLVVPHFFGTAFFIFLLRQFFMTIPQDLMDAARIDGANEFVIWWRVMMPLARPAIMVVAILSFQNTWNDFLAPLLYLQDKNLHTLALGLYYFQGLPGQQTMYNEMMAATVMMVTPILIVFMVFQRQFVQGVTLSGLKG